MENDGYARLVSSDRSYIGGKAPLTSWLMYSCAWTASETDFVNEMISKIKKDHSKATGHVPFVHLLNILRSTRPDHNSESTGTLGEINTGMPGEIDPGTPGEIDPGMLGEINPGILSEINPGMLGEIDPEMPGEIDTGIPGKINTSQKPSATDKSQKQPLTKILPRFSLDASKATNPEPKKTTLKIRFGPKKAIAPLIPQETMIPREPTTPQGPEIPEERPAAAPQTKGGKFMLWKMDHNSESTGTLGEINTGMPGEIDPGTPGEIDPGMLGEINPGMLSEIDPGILGEIDPEMPGEIDTGIPGKINTSQKPSATDKSQKQPLTKILPRFALDASKATNPEPKKTTLKIRFGPKKAIAPLIPQETMIPREPTTPQGPEIPEERPAAAPQTKGGKVLRRSERGCRKDHH
ncbi:hypothetical protein PCASD_10084 [Puccinia coronata f. sp. avenae]|uniref:Uncharacterized protein n=1 Tax=Puccinia coronata f. sp. avenae TaxID=200324 RepID=A0A2N5UW76_9BASI|nr:hypothetical protein PCASD_10084 [Puccinia coronata f. sp. avenae]